MTNLFSIRTPLLPIHPNLISTAGDEAFLRVFNHFILFATGAFSEKKFNLDHHPTYT